MKTEKQIQSETAKHFKEQVSLAGLAELYALEKKIDRHFNAGTLSVKDFATLDESIVYAISRFDEKDREPQWIKRAFNRLRKANNETLTSKDY
tara:strand:- start:12677 stop:12955 length:279 start_codon:yes stop_codon:yes gene_type:complete